VTELEVEGIDGGILYLRGVDSSLVRINVEVVSIHHDESSEPPAMLFSLRSTSPLRQVRKAGQ
jgi:hypothetical protein